MTGKCDGFQKPDIVFFGEPLPHRVEHCKKIDFAKCDLLIVAGTSLQVQPFASLIMQVPASTPRVLFNREPVGSQNAGLRTIQSFKPRRCHRKYCQSETQTPRLARAFIPEPVDACGVSRRGGGDEGDERQRGLPHRGVPLRTGGQLSRRLRRRGLRRRRLKTCRHACQLFAALRSSSQPRILSAPRSHTSSQLLAATHTHLSTGRRACQLRNAPPYARSRAAAPARAPSASVCAAAAPSLFEMSRRVHPSLPNEPAVFEGWQHREPRISQIGRFGSPTRAVLFGFVL